MNFALFTKILLTHDPFAVLSSYFSMYNKYLKTCIPEVWFGIIAGLGERKIRKFFKTAQFICTQVYGGDCTVYLPCRAGSNDSEHAQLNLQKGL